MVPEKKSKAGGWLYVAAVLVVAAALFLPLSAFDPSRSLLPKLKGLSFTSLAAWLLAAAGFWGFRIRFWPGDRRESRRLTECFVLLVAQALLLRTVFECVAACRPLAWSWLPPDVWVWVPWFLVPSLSGILLGGRLGILVCLSGALMLYVFADPGPWPVVGCLASALTGVLLLRRSPTRSRVLRAGAAAGAMLGVVAAFQFAVQGLSVDAIAAAVLVPLSIGYLSAFLVLAALPVFEWMLGELSDVTLIEYGTDHPLLDQLRTKAQGTWYHSLNVADLAEKAGAEVGARALFCKTAALYHDIGKLKEPGLFAENNDGTSPHNRLEPQESARRIIEHVSYGVELARKHRLPKPFREIIAEHHGVSLVRFFHAKACQLVPEVFHPSVDRALFTYPGPTPSTRESGIIALADAVEAASRSLSSRPESDLQAFVRRLIAERVSEGELAECPLTLSDLAKVGAVFVACLKGRNHSRPAYPATAAEPAAGGVVRGMKNPPAKPSAPVPARWAGRPPGSAAAVFAHNEQPLTTRHGVARVIRAVS